MRRGALADMCDERARILDDQVKASRNHLQALAILVPTFQVFHNFKNPSAIDEMTFSRYLKRTAFERPPLTSGLQAYIVTLAKRGLFERQQAWGITNNNCSCKESRPWYGYITLAQRLGDGYKFPATAREDWESLVPAKESGKVFLLTAPFKLLNNRMGVILTYAVYKSELLPNATAQDRIQSCIGYLGGIFDIEAHVDNVLQKLAGKQSIMVNVYDTTSERLTTRMYDSNDTSSGSGMSHISTLNFGDPSRKHEMHCRFMQRPPWPWLAIASSFGTLVVSLLVGYIFHSTDKRIAIDKDGYKEADMQMPVKDEFAATERITEMERDLNERIGRGEIQPECASVRQWPTPILSMTADVIQQTDEPYMDDYVSQPFQWEQQLFYREDARLEAQERLNETERKLEVLGTRSEFITKVKKLACVPSLPSRFHYLNTKVVSISLLGFLLYILVIGAFDQQRLGMRKGADNKKMMLNNFGWSRGRLLIGTLHGTWAKHRLQSSDMIRVDLKKMTGNNERWSSHNSSGIQAVLYVPRNGKQVKIYCNLIADEKALANWMSNEHTGQSTKYQEEATGMQNGTAVPHLPAHKSHKTIVLGPWIALVPVIMLVLLGTAAVWLLLWCNHRRRVQQKELELLGRMGPSRFQLHELAAATSNFACQNKLGQGGFGPVYKGYLSDQDLHVAIKVLSKRQSSQEQSEQGLREFKAEVKVMTQLRHRNIVQLVGWCDSKKRLLLVYELMAQGSLDKHLYDPEKTLTWQQRYKIALDMGSGLLYLHRDCEKCIVHGDIKPANVMLDVSHNAKLGDFGLARLVEHGGEPQTTQVVAGTPGYIDPEFINNRWPRTELDVYSFGVVLLEIACGKRPASRQLPNGASSLLAWVHDLYDQGKILDAADQRLNGEFDPRQMGRVIVTGLWCAHQDPIQRPSIVQAMDVLRSADAELPVLPAAHNARHIRSLEEQAYADLPVDQDDHSVHAITPSAYFTSKDSVYLLTEE